MKIKFCGAAQTVTGSQHLLEIAGKKILLDCGLYQGKREEAYDINRSFLFDPKEIHAVILSHAHIDHSGNLPSIFNKGFSGDIYCTTATRDLCSIMLQDSGHIQEKDTEYVNKKRIKKGQALYKPLYTLKDAQNVMKYFKSISYQRPFNLIGVPDVTVEYFDAGHLLGSALVALNIKDKGKNLRLVFTGDLGRPNLPILKDPIFTGDCDFIISESTYGGKLHDPAEAMDVQLANVLNEAISRGGKIVMPSFSVGRTQEIVYAMSKLLAKKMIPDIPVFVDSPLSVKATDVFRMHPECYDEELSALIASGVDVFELPNLRYVSDVEESKSINTIQGPAIIISSSGMMESGRILHHLKNNVEDPNATILVVGFQAEHTLGRRIVEARDEPGKIVKIFGDEYSVNAKVVVLNSFSGHADNNELLWYFNKYNKKRVENIFLVHGEIDRQQALKSSLNDNGFKGVEIPVKGQIFEI